MKIMNPKDLIEHPYNKELYPNGWSTEDDEMQELRKSMKARLDAGEEFLNTRPIKADEKNVVYGGNRRTYIAKELGGNVQVETTPYTFNPNNEKDDELELLESDNDDKSTERNEKKLQIAIPKLSKRLSVKNERSFRETGKGWSVKNTSEFKIAFGIKWGISEKTLKDAYRIYAEFDRFDLLQAVDDPNDKTTIHQALKIAREGTKKARKVDPNKFNVVAFLKGDERAETIIERAKRYTKQYSDKRLTTSITTDDGITYEVPTNPQFGSEKQFLLTDISNATQFGFAKSFDETGDNALTTQTGINYEDIVFVNKCKAQYEDESLEIKAFTWKGTASKTMATAGKTASTKLFNSKPFLLTMMTSDSRGNPTANSRYFQMITWVTKDDFKSSGDNATMTMQKWYENHFDRPEDYIVITGEVYDSNGKPEFNFAPLM
jgi:hypothetical protein|tara:strand:+ start:89 stop:1390 length:1302 start_codon:yes stop_codon:yes gene_type:complete